MSKKKKNDLLNGISLRLINLKWYLEYLYTTEGAPDFSFKVFEDEYLRKNDPLKDPEFKFESSVRVDRFNSSTPTEELVKKLTLKEYLLFFLVNGEFDTSVMILASLYARRAIENPKTAKLIKPEGLKVFYGICVLLAFKYTNDLDMWPLSEFSNFLGIKPKTVKKYEKFVIDKIFHFNLFVSQMEFQKEKHLLETLIQK